MSTVDTKIGGYEYDPYIKHEFEANQVLRAESLNEMDEQIYRNTNDINDLNENKQDTLVSGTNIKTINDNDILGEGNIDIINNIKIGNYSTEISDNTGEADITEALKNELKDSYGIDYKSINYSSSGASSDENSITTFSSEGIKFSIPNYNENIFEVKVDTLYNNNKGFNDEFFEQIEHSDDAYPITKFPIIAPKIFNDEIGYKELRYKNLVKDCEYIQRLSAIIEPEKNKKLIHEFVIDKNDKILEYSLNNLQLAIGFCASYNDFIDSDFSSDINIVSNLIAKRYWSFANTSNVTFYVESVELDQYDKEITKTTKNITNNVVKHSGWNSINKSTFDKPFEITNDGNAEMMLLSDGYNYNDSSSITVSTTNTINDSAFKSGNKLKIKIYVVIPATTLVLNQNEDLIENAGTYITYVVKCACNISKKHKNFASIFEDLIIVKKGKSLFAISDDGVEMRSTYNSINGDIEDYDGENGIKDCFYGVKVSPYGIFINNGYTNDTYITLDDYVNQQIESSINSAIKKHVADKHT